MRLSMYVIIVAVFWTISAVILSVEPKVRLRLNSDPLPKWLEAREEIQKAFLHAWSGYEKHAWGFDELCTLSKVL